MKLITAIIKPFKLDEVVETLKGLGVQGVTVSEVRGFGRQGGKSEAYRGTEYEISFVAKIRLDVAVLDADADRIVDSIRETAVTGKIGDGKIWMTPLERVTRVRTGEEGADAL